MYVNNWLDRREMLTPDKIALVDTLRGNRTITYRQWNRSANRSARLLYERLGVRKGDRVAVLAANSVAYLDLWFACGKIGAIIQLLNWRLTPVELQGLIADATPRVLVYSPEFAPQVAALREQGIVRQYVAIGSPQAGDVAFSEREGLSDAPPPEVDLDWNDPWAICYTGGTTGLPKGAILTHGNITANTINTVVSWGLMPSDVALLQLPLFHTGGLNVYTAPLVYIGGTSVVCGGFDVDQFFDLVPCHGVTLVVGVPTMFIMMQQHARWAEADLGSIRICGCGGASCPPVVVQRFRERGLSLFTGYGLTEAGPNTFWLPEADRPRKPGAVGVPLMHIDVKTVDGAGNECGAGEVGELLVRGPHVTPGYWNRPQETAEALAGGWLHTGDLASRDAEGYYSIVGRTKDMIISGGENIYPAEVEAVLHAHPAVAEAALIGIPDPKWGEVGCAVIVAKPGAALGAEELLAFCGTRLARYKVPKSVVFVDALPKTAAAKVDKKLLQEQYGKP